MKTCFFSLTSESIYTSLSKQDLNNNNNNINTTARTHHKKQQANRDPNSSGNLDHSSAAGLAENCCHVLVTSLAASQVRLF
jgi:hypothetical protein